MFEPVFLTEVIEGGCVQVLRIADGQNHRYVLNPGADLTNEIAEVATYALDKWTPEIIAAWEARRVVPTPEEIAAQTQRSLIDAVQAHMDAAARALGYDDIKTACTYADEPAVPKFQTDGQAFRAWRSLVWSYCYAQLDAVTAGERTVPTVDVLIGELPKLSAEV